MDYRGSQSPYGTPRLDRPSTAAGPSDTHETAQPPTPLAPSRNPTATGKFDILEWYPQYQSCCRYFLEVSQHSYPCQALAAFINIRLPFQRHNYSEGPPTPAVATTRYSSSSTSGPVPPPPPLLSTASSSSSSAAQSPADKWVSLHPYIRRLVATGFDVPPIMHGWFGDDWSGGIGPLHEQERRNYLFAAKSGGWAKVKRDYDEVLDEAVPYLKSLGMVEDGEIEAGEESWSKWLAMEDWMLGSREPPLNDSVEHMER